MSDASHRRTAEQMGRLSLKLLEKNPLTPAHLKAVLNIEISALSPRHKDHRALLFLSYQQQDGFVFFFRFLLLLKSRMKRLHLNPL